MRGGKGAQGSQVDHIGTARADVCVPGVYVRRHLAALSADNVLIIGKFQAGKCAFASQCDFHVRLFSGVTLKDLFGSYVS